VVRARVIEQHFQSAGYTSEHLGCLHRLTAAPEVTSKQKPADGSAGFFLRV